MTLLVHVEGERGARWMALFAEHAPDIPVRRWPDIGPPEDVRWLLAWVTTPELIRALPNLQVLFATSAGVDQLPLAALPAQVQLVRMLDPNIAEAVAQYLCMAVLCLHRQLPQYLRQQRGRQWLPEPARPARQRRVGLMGLGQMGQAAALRLRPFGFELLGWARSTRQLNGVRCYAGAQQLAAFLGQCDILVCLLPLTEATRGMLSDELFAALPRGACLVNLGRGGHLDEPALLRALDSGQLQHAVLDVLGQEPAPPEHPFWEDERIWLTPHIGAMTAPEDAFALLLANLRRHLAGEPMLGVADRNAGY
ncbi:MULTISPECIES: glyoxylate/hydroxypyruvate reductase A [unclassified Pseudomonas]|uniref:2-hydroxyacid dehydrogenase n=1 Tax=unclassified Pseudomonas TaxID=196821 RepID=UPI000BC67B39|nr:MULTISPECIES: glyoxylate/hydroxypyruvate reductase A [unclassified Pseudomonas]PVZ19687.1 glyoxylate/hydroxypyruvate reductase A [Pseudomonas sp. URIL14HWK12:I12]PVZ22728.1 glyoxylate/hydroxypyruvate reductase A [Pseudomonas sp. URIL14HWK12:I10]PVZ37642.1 glyoxylate/hydroxypyruvate reductase A [Pseudomonas sp. URIL14HWK12:I11]SNZ15350.1 glyoxylate/hydroxypyruvate reductase A [Pseudomonas sp. URIL14HWK12:I9]